MTTAKRYSFSNRNTYYGLIHKGAMRMLKAEFGEHSAAELDGAYRMLLERETGQRSCKNLTWAQLDALYVSLRDAGWLEDTRNYRPGGSAPDRPTDAQWAKLAALCRQRGWKQGLKSPNLAAFVKHTVHVDKVQFLTKSTITLVITGLEKWLKGGSHGNS
ncbi:regulatory protein GemA [Lelliottia sp. SL45]|uniref:regulatory protein GemA n=1 Tax=Lelliottia sp. SL45 TaxID=2994665 RepID=UPI002274DADF|nr:regulatory protein GemA [Lelliottia sp. SL45]MCY1697167.1 regulatory protein GemA [Lelliottia sp. SL45]